MIIPLPVILIMVGIILVGVFIIITGSKPKKEQDIAKQKDFQ